MSLLLKIVSWVGLALTLLPSILFLFDVMSLEALKTAMTIGMLLWLISAPLIQRAKAKTVSDPL